MKIGIIFAMNEELEALKKYVKIYDELKIYDLTFYKSKINNVECILVESGIGKVNAARTTQILIDNIKVDYVFNIGVAGGLTNNLKIGDIVLGEKLVQHDFDITAFNNEKGFIPNIGKYIDTDKHLVSLVKDIDKDLITGVIASGDIFCTDINMSKKIHDKFNALCVEMEGASIAQVCFLDKVPFLIIRSISDIPNNNNNITFDEFLVSSSDTIAKLMIKIINKLS